MPFCGGIVGRCWRHGCGRIRRGWPLAAGVGRRDAVHAGARAHRLSADAGGGAVGGGPVRVRAGRGGEGAHAPASGRAGPCRPGSEVHDQFTRRGLVITPTGFV